MRKLKEFTATDVKILELRDKYNMTFESIGKEVSLSRSRVTERYNRLKSILHERAKFDKYKDFDPKKVDDSIIKDYAYAHLSTLSYNGLCRAHKLDSVNALINTSDKELAKIRNIGAQSYYEIKNLINLLKDSQIEEKFDFNDDEIDPEILDIVKNFNRVGIKTIFSCQGHAKLHDDELNEDYASYPYLMTKYPEDDSIFLLVVNTIRKYPMLELKVESRTKYAEIKYDNTDEYIEKINKLISDYSDTNLYISANDLLYNIPLPNNPDDESHFEDIFENLRKRFIKELSEASNIIYNTVRNRKFNVNTYYKKNTIEDKPINYENINEKIDRLIEGSYY